MSGKAAMGQLPLQRLGGRHDAYLRQLPRGSYITVKIPVTPKLVERQLNGEVTIGIFMLEGDKVSYATVDFDSEGDAYLEKLRKPMLVVKRLLYHYRVDCLLVDSGSRGYHIHVFFEEPVKATLARELLRGILCRAEKDTGLAMLGFEVFPKQGGTADGFGNAPKLPCGTNRKSGRRRAILNDDLQPVEDEEEALKSVAATPTGLVIEAFSELPSPESQPVALKSEDGGWVAEASYFPRKFPSCSIVT